MGSQEKELELIEKKYKKKIRDLNIIAIILFVVISLFLIGFFIFYIKESSMM